MESRDAVKCLASVTLPPPKGKFFHAIIPGEPMPWKRPGKFRNNLSADYQQQFRKRFLQACPEASTRIQTPYFGVRFRFVSSVAVPGDADNLAKNVLDALNGTVWDDRQIRELLVWGPVPGFAPHTEILIYPLDVNYVVGMGDE